MLATLSSIIQLSSRIVPDKIPDMENSCASVITLLLISIWTISSTAGVETLNETKLRNEQKHVLSKQALDVNQGDVVRIVAPARAAPETTLPLISAYVESLGLIPNITENIFNQSEPIYSNWDEFRANDFISALLDDSVKIIWCIRGGTGSIRLIPYLEQQLPATLNHKIFIGYSDITVLHLYLHKKYGWQTLHGPMLEAIARQVYDQSGQTVVSLTNLIFERQESICFDNLTPLNENNFVTDIESKVVGGNVALVEASIGTLWQVTSKGNILFLEDVGEAAYSIERSLDHMKQSGIFDSVEAVIFGDFVDADNNTLMDVVLERFAESASFPVFRVSGIGHGSINYPLPLGTPSQITRLNSGTYRLCVDNIQGFTNGSNRKSSGNLLERMIICIVTIFLIAKIK